VVGLVVFGVLAFCTLVVVGTLVAATWMLGWLIWLPFKILGFVLRGVGLLLFAPILFVAGLIALVCFGFGTIALLIPAFPLVLLALGVAWLFRHSSRAVSTS
jgi:hypothetical protein